MQYACKSHSTKHPNIPSDFPILSHSLLARWWWLHKLTFTKELEKWLGKQQTFSLKIQPVGSLYWGASCDANRLPKTQRGALERKARIDGFGGIEWWCQSWSRFPFEDVFESHTFFIVKSAKFFKIGSTSLEHYISTGITHARVVDIETLAALFIPYPFNRHRTILLFQRGQSP